LRVGAAYSLEGGRALGNVIKEFNKTVHMISEVHQRCQQEGLILQPLIDPISAGATALNAVNKVVETIPTVTRRVLRFMGVNPATAQDMGDGVGIFAFFAGPGKFFKPLGSVAKVESFITTRATKGKNLLSALDLPEMKIFRGIDGKIKGVTGTQKHHIIHEALKEHELWNLAGRDPQKMSNIMLLPTKKGAELFKTEKTIHQGRHTNKSKLRLERQMDEFLKQGKQENWLQEQYSQALDKIIEKEREALKTGDRILNKNYRPWATDN
jgi:hypothetical protein